MLKNGPGSIQGWEPLVKKMLGSSKFKDVNVIQHGRHAGWTPAINIYQKRKNLRRLLFLYIYQVPTNYDETRW